MEPACGRHGLPDWPAPCPECEREQSFDPCCFECAKHQTDENGWPVTVTTFIVCPDCGNKRCPKATDHRNECTGSNEPGQKGSLYE